MTDAPTTLLVLSGMGVPPYSARGLTQSLTPIPATQQARRTVNGTLADVSAVQFRKYASTIKCTDQQAPALDGIWPGDILTIDCVSELSFATDTGGPIRDVVPGSEREESGFTFYRPRLTMMVIAFEVDTDEYSAATGWTISLEEV